MKKKTYKILAVLAMVIGLNGCVSDLKLNQGSILASSAQCYQGKNTILTIIPTYGAIGDNIAISLAKSTKKDEGISKKIRAEIHRGNKYFSFYSRNNEKMSSILNATLSKFRNDELSGVHICYIGTEALSATLEKEIKRTGADYKNISR